MLREGRRPWARVHEAEGGGGRRRGVKWQSSSRCMRMQEICGATVSDLRSPVLYPSPQASELRVHTDIASFHPVSSAGEAEEPLAPPKNLGKRERATFAALLCCSEAVEQEQSLWEGKRGKRRGGGRGGGGGGESER